MIYPWPCLDKNVKLKYNIHGLMLEKCDLIY